MRCCPLVRYLFIAYPGAFFPPGVQIPPLSAEERQETHAFALRCVGIMATAARISTGGGFEKPFAQLLRDFLRDPSASNRLEPSFKTELTRLWHRPALQTALRTRRVFEGEDAATGRQRTARSAPHSKRREQSREARRTSARAEPAVILSSLPKRS